jgi:hypothetical protein
MNVSITSVFPTRERLPEEETFRICKLVESKVLDFVFERISHAKGGLFPSITAPQNVIDLLPDFEVTKAQHMLREKRKAILCKAPPIRKVPIGLKSVDPEGWINALMQFILFVPGFSELFFFAPHSYRVFREFIDQYDHDQQQQLALSSANASLIFQLLVSKLASLNLMDVFRFITQVLHTGWEVCKSLEEAVVKGFKNDLFVTETESKRSFFVQLDRYYYDLDVFVEQRPDGALKNFIAYVKVGGGWYQCDNERIVQLRSNQLEVPLHRAVLLHYKRINVWQ